MFSNYFRFSRNRIFYILMLLPVCIPLSAMEPVDMPGDNAQEAIPLLDIVHENHQEARDLGLQMAMEDEDSAELDEQKSVFFDGSRRFYDDESRKQAKIKALKDSLIITAFFTTVGTGFSIGSIRLIEYLCEWCRPMNVQDYLIWTSVIISYWLILSSISEYARTIKPAIAERNPFNGHPSSGSSETEEHLVTIPLEMIDAADNTKIVCVHNTNIQALYDTCSSRLFNKLRFEILRHMFFSNKNIEFHNKIQTHLENSCIPLREQYRNLAYQLKRFLVNKLPREVVVQVFSNFPNHNILEHILSHQPESRKEQKVSFLNEAELLLLMEKSNFFTWKQFHQYGLSPYLTASILAENGWIAFSKSQKYPIRCDMKFFNTYAMPNDDIKRYFAKFVNPTIYLPYSPEIAQYYKFEDDPAYAIEHEAPSSKKIERLLQLRQEIIARNPALLQPIPNNNNIN